MTLDNIVFYIGIGLFSINFVKMIMREAGKIAKQNVTINVYQMEEKAKPEQLPARTDNTKLAGINKSKRQSKNSEFFEE